MDNGGLIGRSVKTLYLDCFAGISGDMMIGLLLDLGLELDVLKQDLQLLPLQNEEGYHLKQYKVNKMRLQATKFDVFLSSQNGEEHLADSEFVEVARPDSKDVFVESYSAHHHPHRSLSQILDLIGQSGLKTSIKRKVQRIFTRLGEAEAQAHGMSLEKVDFHEVGGVDAMIDIVGTVIGLEHLGIERIESSALHLGSGFVRMAHGLYPVPGPTTANLIKHIPVYASEIKGELVTPTGAALVTTLAENFGPMPMMTIQAVGYGAGSRDREFPNVLRGFLGQIESTQNG